MADVNSQHWCGNNLNFLLNSPVLTMPGKTNPTGKKKKVVHADATRDTRKAIPSWKQVFPALGPSPSGPRLTGTLGEQSGSPVTKCSRASQRISSPSRQIIHAFASN